VLYENGTEEHRKIVENFEKLHYFFVYGYSSVFGESFFSNNQSYELMNNEIPFLCFGENNDNFILNATNTELNGFWTEGIRTHLNPFDSKRKPILNIVHKKSKAKKKAIILHTCELSKYFSNVPLTIRKISYLFYFAEDEPNSNEVEEIIDKDFDNVIVLQKYLKYKENCDIVGYTFNGCPPAELMENVGKSKNTQTWIYLFVFAAVLFIIFEMSCE
jgi:triacylglycerol esterase/lipase EstA (alpha/beta hydrolase family)